KPGTHRNLVLRGEVSDHRRGVVGHCEHAENSSSLRVGGLTSGRLLNGWFSARRSPRFPVAGGRATGTPQLSGREKQTGAGLWNIPVVVCVRYANKTEPGS